MLCMVASISLGECESLKQFAKSQVPGGRLKHFYMAIYCAGEFEPIDYTLLLTEIGGQHVRICVKRVRLYDVHRPYPELGELD